MHPICSHKLEWVKISQEIYDVNLLLLLFFFVVVIFSALWTLSLCIEVWETLLVKTKSKNAFNNSALSISIVFLFQSAVSPHFPCLFLKRSSSSWPFSCQFLPCLSFGFPHIIIACLESISAFLLCSLFFLPSLAYVLFAVMHYCFSQTRLLVHLPIFQSILMSCCVCRRLSLKTRSAELLLPFRAASHKIPPISSLNKPNSPLVKSRVCTLLLTFLIPLRILNSTEPWLLQPRLPQLITSTTSSPLFVANQGADRLTFVLRPCL